MKDFIRDIRVRYNIEKDSELADLMGLTRAAISAHKKGRAKHFSQASAYRIAELLNLNPAYVLLCLEWEQSPTPSIKTVWRQLAQQIDKYAAAVFLAVVLPYFVFKVSGLYIMSNYKNWFLVRVVHVAA